MGTAPHDVIYDKTEFGADTRGSPHGTRHNDAYSGMALHFTALPTAGTT